MFLLAMIHYCQEDFVVIKITGKNLSIRKYSKSEALAEDLESFLIQGLRPKFLLLQSPSDCNEIPDNTLKTQLKV